MVSVLAAVVVCCCGGDDDGVHREAPSYITRVWCLFEFSCSSKTIEIALSGEQVQAFFDLLKRDQDQLSVSFRHIDMEGATSYHPRDRERIFEVVRAKGGFEGFNSRIERLIGEWVANMARKLGQHFSADDRLDVLDDMTVTRFAHFITHAFNGHHTT